jgi:hypothetical protein
LTVASLRNITYQDQGVNWKIGFAYSPDNGVSIPWTQVDVNIPADLDDINQDELEQAMLELAMFVARGQGHDV